MDETNQIRKVDEDIGLPIIPIVLGDALATGPIFGTGIQPFIGGHFFNDKTGDISIEEDDEEQEDELRR